MKYLYLFVALLLLTGCQPTSNEELDNGKESTAVQKVNPTRIVQENEVLKFSAVITNSAYSPTVIDVPFGATVELTVKNNDNQNHGLSFQDFGIQGFVGPGQTKTIRFVANSKGQAPSFCSTAHPEKLIINVT